MTNANPKGFYGTLTERMDAFLSLAWVDGASALYDTLRELGFAPSNAMALAFGDEGATQLDTSDDDADLPWMASHPFGLALPAADTLEGCSYATLSPSELLVELYRDLQDCGIDSDRAWHLASGR